MSSTSLHRYIFALSLIGLFGSHFSLLAQPDWSRSVSYPLEGRPNPYELDSETQMKFVRAGKIHALNYPVTVTGALLPYEPIRRMAEPANRDLFQKVIQFFVGTFFKIDSFDGIQAWLGLVEYPEVEGYGVYEVPFLNGERPENRMGFSLIDRKGVKGFTKSCAACHTGSLFGRPVIGLTNRFPNANEFFVKGKKGSRLVGPTRFRILTGASRKEAELYGQARKSIRAVGARRPEVLGLDTSGSHIIRSLARRNQDDVLSRNPRFERFPRKDVRGDWMTESKPAPWWNVKYKNRWFLDGSLVSGNPIVTAIVWNEIGRGVDLEELEEWLSSEEQTLKELTSAVMSSQAPRITDFVSPERLNLQAAMRGQKTFENRCSKCHGHYEKAWEVEGFEKLPLADQFETTRVSYHRQTPVKNIGTDPTRAVAIDPILPLNDLRVMKKFGIRLEPQEGYVPPPLVGIWARWPYLHNNSIPSLCALMMPEEERPKFYYAGPPIELERDFDLECNGYPTGAAVPEEWKRNTRATYRVKEGGLSNKGHSRGIFIKNGKEVLSAEEKRDLVRYLQTL